MRDSISKREFAEFYVLNAISPMLNNNIHSKLLNYRNKLVLSIADFYIENLREICITEALHTERKWPKGTVDGNKRDRLRRLGISNSSIITEAFLYAKNNLFLGADRLIAIFEDMEWEEFYGGENWKQIANLYKELLMARNNFATIDECDFDPDNGYDVYTHSSIKKIRQHLAGENEIAKLSGVIDKVHQLEHNTGKLFNKFAYSMMSWNDKLMNEKATPASIQLLRNYVGPETKEVVKSLPIADVSSDELERQLGQVILHKEEAEHKYSTEQEIKSTLEELEHNYNEGLIGQAKYESEKARLVSDIKWYRDDINIYSKALSDYSGQLRERRGILREMIEVSKTDKRLLDPNNDLLGQLLNDIMTDYAMFELLVNAPHWHNELIRILTPYYFKLNIKWAGVFSDLVYNNYDKILAEQELSVAMIATLYENLKIDGYNMDKFDLTESDDMEKPKPVSHVEVESFVKTNFGKEITGTTKWFDEHVNTQSSFYAVSKCMPIGTVVGWKHPNKICFTPSEHWKLNSYPGRNTDFEYYGEGKKPLVYEIELEYAKLYTPNAFLDYGKPRNYKDFAHVYAGEKIVVNDLLNYTKWKINEPFGIIIGYGANRDKKGYIYYIPLDSFKAAGYEGAKPAPGEIIYTLEGMNDDNVPACGNIKYNDISICVSPEHKNIDVIVPKSKLAPPKGSVDSENFVVKYIGKQIKASYKFGKCLNAVRKWNVNYPIGTIVGIDKNKRVCFAPSQAFEKAGWRGVLNFDSIEYVLDEYKADRYYAIDLANIELLSPEDYEDQYRGEIIDSDLSPNQVFALDHAGKTIAGKGATWTKIVPYDTIIGTVIGYKGDLLCYTPSQKLIDLGYKGEDIEDIVYTDTEHAGDKCYTIISAAAVRLHTYIANDVEDFCTRERGRIIRAKGGMWKDLVNADGKKWNMSNPLGKLIGFHKIHNTLCFVPSEELREFGFTKGNKCYIGVEFGASSEKDKSKPYYQIVNYDNIESIVVPVKPFKAADGERFATEHCGKMVKRRHHIGNTTTGWDITKPVGTIVGYKPNGSIVWVPTEEYAKMFKPSEVTDDMIIVDVNFPKGTLVHSCWQTSLDLVYNTTKDDGWIKTGHNTYVYGPKKKKKRVKDRPWDKPIGVEPIDMPPYVELE